MFYHLIKNKCEEWYQSSDCTVGGVVEYIKSAGYMRDAQLEAIKIYLFLKIAGGNRPLYDLFLEGFFNTLDIDELPLSVSARAAFKANPAAVALYEFAAFKDDSGNEFSPQLAKRMRENPLVVDSKEALRQIFAGKHYTEYLYSLPMGAGKTFLMAAFIYLDLYYAILEPKNPAFSHNFLILAPSGLKSSVVPSLKTIQRFNPAWVLAEPAASQVKKILKFEVLDAQKTQAKSNKVKNPNVQKIVLHQADPDLTGLVVVTNAEKVILDRLKLKAGEIDLFADAKDEKDRQANELRNRLGKLPYLAIFIDEAHHAADDDIKLRGVVTNWTQTGGNINSVVGFSGTPYLARPMKIELGEKLGFKSEEIPTIVYYYRLVDGIGNFLKRPTVKRAVQGMESVAIVNEGLREFFRRYKDVRYEDGTLAKIAVFCSNIKNLEGIYSDVAAIVEEAGLNPEEAILKFHRGNKEFKAPEGAQLEFDSLDTDVSKKRVVLLAEIGKEGWDCRSLTGVILSQKGACPLNKVLQTSCRCLRQVAKESAESALIYLNEDNAALLEKQLKKQHHLTVSEFERGNEKGKTIIRRYDRTEVLELPKVEFVQLEVEYTLERSRKVKNIDKEIRAAVSFEARRKTELIEQDFAGAIRERSQISYGIARKEPAVFAYFLQQIAKESFGTLAMDVLQEHEPALREVFDEITAEEEGMLYYRGDIVPSVVRSNIRKAFVEEWHYKTRQEKIPQESSLLRVENFTPEVLTAEPQKYYPETEMVEKIIRNDRGEFVLSEKLQQAIELLMDIDPRKAEELKREQGMPSGSDRSYHYLPYHMDSSFEIEFLKELLPDEILAQRNLEVYYNGDRSLTEFRIKCYEKQGRDYRYVGMYTPDFLILQRVKGKIARAVIVETKGSLYANDPNFAKRKAFMETTFRKLNPNFDYLYLEDTMPSYERRQITHEKIKKFFQEAH